MIRPTALRRFHAPLPADIATSLALQGHGDTAG